MAGLMKHSKISLLRTQIPNNAQKNFTINNIKVWLIIVMILLIAPGQLFADQGFTETKEGNTTYYNQTDLKVYNEVTGYNIGSDESHIYSQPSADAIFLQRITGDLPSSILGELIANGHVWVLNPNGVFISKDASINTAGFLASSMVMEKDDFFSGKYNMVGEGSGGYVINNGTINAGDEGYVVLVGASVANNGTISADKGKVVMAAADKISVDFYGDGLINYALDEKTAAKIIGPDGSNLSSAVKNSGKISAATVVMTANAAKSVFESVVNNEGVIEAASVYDNGCIQLLGGAEGNVINTGELSAKGNGAKIEIQSADDITVDGIVVVDNDGTISIVADRDNNGSGNIYAGKSSQ